MRMAFIAIAALVAATPALAQESAGDMDFVLTNQTGKALKSLQIKATPEPEFKPDSAYAEEPGKSAVKAGGRTTIHFTKGAGCKYDLKGTFEDDTTAVWSGFDACEDPFMTVALTGGKPTFKDE